MIVYLIVAIFLGILLSIFTELYHFKELFGANHKGSLKRCYTVNKFYQKMWLSHKLQIYKRLPDTSWGNFECMNITPCRYTVQHETSVFSVYCTVIIVPKNPIASKILTSNLPCVSPGKLRFTLLNTGNSRRRNMRVNFC